MTVKHIHADVETRSPVDLRTCGAYPYFEHPDTKVLMMAYRLDDGPLQIWTYDRPCPDDLAQAIRDGATIVAWNAQFEHLAFDLLADRCGWPRPHEDAYLDTAAAAAAMSLPRALGDAAAALGLDVQKDKDGQRLIRKFSIPRKPKKDEPPGLYWNEPEDHVEDFKLFMKYCMNDVATEEAAARRLVPLSDDEQRVWLLDQRINRRGIRIDTKSARAAIRLADKAKARLDREMVAATAGYVRKCSEPGKLIEWVQEQGVDLTSAAKSEITDLLELDDVPAHVRKALEIRQEAAKTSVSKLSAMMARASSDGRVRGTFMYHGASTGRWSNTGVNFANLPRPRKIYEKAIEDGLTTQALFEAIRHEDPDWLVLQFGDKLGRPLHLLSDAIRGFIWAAPDHDLLQADYSGIEGAVIAWLADEDWKVQALFDIKADPTIPDLYRQTAAQIMNTTTDVITKKHPLRQSVGKVSELACFSADTRVLTNNGVKRIVAVRADDLLWDGVEWIKHQGLISKGVRPVVDVDGIGVTPDHLILTGRTWKPALELASNASFLSQALATGSENLPSSVSSRDRLEAQKAHWLSVRAVAILTSLTFTISRRGQALVVGTARKRNVARPGRTILATMTSCRTTAIDADFSIASRLASTDAPTRTIRATRTMADVAFRYFGAAIAGRICNILSRSTAGTNRTLSSIEKTSTETTRQGTFVSSREKSTLEIGARRKPCSNASPSSKKKSETCVEVFDILMAGPRNRFTIFSNSGALVVHNCGFGGGVSAFYSMATTYGVKLDELFPHVWETADEERRAKAVKRYEGSLKRGKDRTTELSREAWVACELIKVGWRAANPAIAASWRHLEGAVRQAVQNPGEIFHAAKCSYKVAQGFLWCRLPSGRCLAYGSPRLKDQVWAKVLLPDGSWSDSEVVDKELAEKNERAGTMRIEGNTSPKVSALGVNSTTRKWERFGLYGGLIAENCTQAVARDLLVNGMVKAERAGYPIIATVYDEIITEVPRGFGDVAEFERLICELPAWADGLPLTASGWRNKRYKKD